MNKFLIALALMFYLAACGGGEQSTSQSNEPTTETSNDNPVQTEAAEPEAVVSEAGKKVYDQYCIVCHQADGKGVPNAFPTLINTDWVLGDKERLIGVILNGLTGEIEVNGETYNSAMTPHDFLSDQEIADVLTYVRGSFGNDAGPVTAEEVASVRTGG